ncbi:GNAT family N-acetyltransferase [Chelativorans sp. M5D2P16]|uniref:GNAT family N-acetyltransferase n=1 Tax=Chelativorans sp. M5D2P16 TaxID=3095678 RepID=UPI002ACA987E|nr:GNAT family N-acetyltransferase [Chelativorans sp. M5D2P16]MDZ5697662.1 GNAT family N-acetyltransferase [Chelativorans sp. M5D2P16]
MTETAERFFVRTTMRADLEAVRALLVETWHDSYDALMGRDRVSEIVDSWHSIPALAARLERPRSEFIVADDGACIAGVAYAEASACGKTVALRQLYVLPGLQGRGIGSRLLNEIVECYPEARRMRLEVAEGNVRAIAFYRARGFEEAGREADPQGSRIVLFEHPLAVYGEG